MKTIKLMIAICLIAGLAQKLLAEGFVSGIYLTSEDYLNHKLNYQTNGSDGNYIKLNEFFGSGSITVSYNGEKKSISKGSIFGYRYNDQDYRYFNNTAFRIVDTKDFYIYSAPKTEHISKGIKHVEDYYFSTTAATEIQPLSIKNLQSTFASNTKFRYLVESDFATDRALTAYDTAVKEYKVKYLYEQSSSM